MLYATRVYDSLIAYLPVQVVYVISTIVFALEKIVLPKFYQVYASASLDPKTLIPFAVSAIALYITMVSIYHAAKASLRMIWWTIKWSLVLAVVWYALGLANQIAGSKDYHEPIYRSSKISSGGEWWKFDSWKPVNYPGEITFDPFQIIFGQSALSFMDSTVLFDFLSSPLKVFDRPSKPSSTPKQNPSKPNVEDQNDRSPPIILENAKRIWTENFQIPFQNIVDQAQKSYNNKARHQTRQKNR